MKYTELKFNTNIQSKNIDFYGQDCFGLSGTANIEWRVVISSNDEGIVSIEPDMSGGISIEIEKESPDDNKSTEMYVIGNEVGCQQYDDRIHFTYEKDFEVHFNTDEDIGSSGIFITDIEVDFDKRKITLL